LIDFNANVAIVMSASGEAPVSRPIVDHARKLWTVLLNYLPKKADSRTRRRNLR
jgi:hypothetical protein